MSIAETPVLAPKQIMIPFASGAHGLATTADLSEMSGALVVSGLNLILSAGGKHIVISGAVVLA